MTLRRGPKLGLMLIAFAMSFALAPERTKVVHADEDDVSLTGCIVQGNDGDNGFLLTNVLPASIDMSTRAAARDNQAEQGASVSASADPASQGTAANLPGASNVVYLLNDLENDDDLPNFTGKRVEVRGELKGNVEKGQMEVERDGDWVKLEIKSDGKNVKTRIPYVSVMPNPTNSVGTSGSTRMKDDDEIKLNINVRKLDVKDVKIVSGSCGS